MKNEDTKLILQIVKDTQNTVKSCEERLYEIEKLDAVQNAELKEHTRRSAANEKRIETIEKRQWSEKLFTGTVIAAVLAVMKFFNF